MTQSVTSKYLIDNDQDMRWGLTINTVGYQHIDVGEPYPPKEHPAGYSFLASRGRVLEEYQFVYITRGKGVFSSKSLGETAIKAGDMFLLFLESGTAITPTKRRDGMNTGLDSKA